VLPGFSRQIGGLEILNAGAGVWLLTDAQSSAADAERGRHVLFVNADADLRSVVTRVLERERFRVCAVPHSGHALLLCRTERFDVAIVELAGPDISGPSLLEQLRRHQPDLSSIYLANPGSPEGVEHLLVHPFTTEDLLGEIQGALSGIAA
jgi:DNA-binding response OmpR family regulator